MDDEGRADSEDFARATIHYVDDAGAPLIAEVTTSCSFVGAGLRLSSELLGHAFDQNVAEAVSNYSNPSLNPQARQSEAGEAFGLPGAALTGWLRKYSLPFTYRSEIRDENL